MDHIRATSKDFETAWIEFRRNHFGDATFDRLGWVVDCSVLWPHSRPTDFWRGVVGITLHDLTEWEVKCLGAGPLENLLATRFDDFAPLALQEGLGKSRFAKALRTVRPDEAFEDAFDCILAALEANMSC